MQLNANIRDPELMKWVESLPNRSETIRLALYEYKRNHYDRIFITEKEFKNMLTITEDEIKEAMNTLKELKEAVTRKEGPKERKEDTRENRILSELEEIEKDQVEAGKPSEVTPT